MPISFTGQYPSVIRSIQQGTITMTGGTSSATATISSVDTATAYPILLGVSSSSSLDGFDVIRARIDLTNATTVTATRGITTTLNGTLSVNFVVVEPI